MKQIIIGLSGPIASGKGEIKQYLETEYEAVSFKFSDILREILQRLNIAINRENLQSLSTDLRNRFGNDILAKTIAQDSINSNSKIIIIDGVRRVDDIKYLLPLSNFKLISVEADIKLRYERIKLRNENEGDQNKSFEQFIQEEAREAELEIPKVMALANFKIINNLDLTSLYEQTKIIMNDLIKK